MDIIYRNQRVNHPAKVSLTRSKTGLTRNFINMLVTSFMKKKKESKVQDSKDKSKTKVNNLYKDCLERSMKGRNLNPDGLRAESYEQNKAIFPNLKKNTVYNQSGFSKSKKLRV